MEILSNNIGNLACNSLKPKLIEKAILLYLPCLSNRQPIQFIYFSSNFKYRLNVVSLPNLLSASILPPMASYWVFTKKSPIPLPFT
jgi:hypothetical protein